MKSIDVKVIEDTQLAVNLATAMKGDNEEDIAKAFAAYAKSIEDKVIAEASRFRDETDARVLASRGVRVLTANEHKYYQKVTEAMRSANPRMALDTTDMRMPETIIDQVLDDVVKRHPLLEAINFTPTSLLTSWDMNAQKPQAAIWGDITATITEELAGKVVTEQVTLMKLSAFFPVSVNLLDLGPAWLDRYIRAILTESIALGCENAIVEGTGVKQPIGMSRDLKESIDPSTGYSRKAATAVTAFDPEGYGKIVGDLAVDSNGEFRTIDNLILIVNPLDYYTLVMPATVRQTVDGGYINDVFPIPTKVIPVSGMTQGEAIIGIGDNYWFGIGGGTNGGKIEFSDEYKWLEEQRYYKVKMYGNGRPVDNTSFAVLDISGLEPYAKAVKIVGGASI